MDLGSGLTHYKIGLEPGRARGTTTTSIAMEDQQSGQGTDGDGGSDGLIIGEGREGVDVTVDSSPATTSSSHISGQKMMHRAMVSFGGSGNGVGSSALDESSNGSASSTRHNGRRPEVSRSSSEKKTRTELEHRLKHTQGVARTASRDESSVGSSSTIRSSSSLRRVNSENSMASSVETERKRVTAITLASVASAASEKEIPAEDSNGNRTYKKKCLTRHGSLEMCTAMNRRYPLTLVFGSLNTSKMREANGLLLLNWNASSAKQLNVYGVVMRNSSLYLQELVGLFLSKWCNALALAEPYSPTQHLDATKRATRKTTTPTTMIILQPVAVDHRSPRLFRPPLLPLPHPSYLRCLPAYLRPMKDEYRGPCYLRYAIFLS